jgi:hypothetical protein
MGLSGGMGGACVTVCARPSSSVVQIGWIGDSVSTSGFTNAPAQYASLTRIVSNWAVVGTRWLTGDIPNQFYTNVTNQTRVGIAGGINDLNGGADGAALARFVTGFTDLRLATGWQLIINNVGPIRGYSGWTQAIQDQIDAYNLALAQYATRLKLPYVDCYHLWENPVLPDYLNPAYDSGDGLHPNAAGGAVWAAALATVAP